MVQASSAPTHEVGSPIARCRLHLVHVLQRVIARAPECIQLPFVFGAHVCLRASAFRFPLRDFGIPLIDPGLELSGVLLAGDQEALLVTNG